jgi:hypothetical protein
MKNIWWLFAVCITFMVCVILMESEFWSIMVGRATLAILFTYSCWMVLSGKTETPS